MEQILVIGGGPAGAAAAIQAASDGAAVRLAERSRLPKHKVCGEFLSPGVLPILHSLGVEFGSLQPAPIRECRLVFGHREKRWKLADPACGLSRFALDRLLLERAGALGVSVCRGGALSPGVPHARHTATILAAGRIPLPSTGRRMFGFKAHFEGPQDDAIELFFGPHGYAGVSAIENGGTNVCGIAPESELQRCGFDVDEFVAQFPALGERLRPLRRRMEWLRTGPLCFSAVSDAAEEDRIYRAGDALGFVDPFTGSGIVNALFTGRLAGANAANDVPVREHLRQCRAKLHRPFGIAAIFRKLIEWNCASRLAALTPGPWLFRLTRAQFS